jgi:hypothetical protein
MKKTTPLYMKTSDMANLIGYSGDFLMKNREILFFKDVHYFPKEKRTDWKVSKMIEWVEGKNISSKAQEILNMLS